MQMLIRMSKVAKHDDVRLRIPADYKTLRFARRQAAGTPYFRAPAQAPDRTVIGQ